MAATPPAPARERRRRSWRRYGSLLFTAVTIGLILLFQQLAERKLAWWKDARFAGRVVARQARDARSNAVADPAAAAADKKPARYHFFLQIDTVDGVEEHRVTLSVFQRVQPGWTIEKPAGTYEAALTPPPRSGDPAPSPPGRGPG